MGMPLQGGRNTGSRIVSVMLAALLAVTMLPAAGLQAAYADEPVERPATSGGDVALSGTSGGVAAAPQAPVAEEREGGMLAAGGLMYTVADGGLALVGFDGDAPAGALAVPAAVSVDGKETPVVAIDLAEGQAADEVVALSLPQGVKDINTATLASAFPALLSVEVAGASSSLPVAAGAASMRAAYSASGGMVFRPATVEIQGEEGAPAEAVECKELLWAPPALAVARIPVECRAIAEGAFANVRDLKAIVTFGTMARIAEGALTSEQISGAKVVVPNESPAVVDEGTERVSASMALMNDEGQMERRRPWHEAGFASEDIVMGKPYGSLTETVAVTSDGTIASDEARLISYPGMHPEATDVKHPGEDGKIDMAESGLAFTVKSDMTASVAWQGDKTATPSHIEIPASVVIDDVTYPVTEIAPSAFEGAAFLTSVAIPEGVTTIGGAAFANCANLTEATFPVTLKATGIGAFDGTQVDPPTLATATRVPLAASGDAAQTDGATGANDAVRADGTQDATATVANGDSETNHPTPSRESIASDSISSYAATDSKSFALYTNSLTSSQRLKFTNVGSHISIVDKSSHWVISFTGTAAVGGVTWTANGNSQTRGVWQLMFRFYGTNGGNISDSAEFTIEPSAGYVFTGIEFDTNVADTGSSLTPGWTQPKLFIGTARVETNGNTALATQDYVGTSAADTTSSTIAGKANSALTSIGSRPSSGFSSTNLWGALTEVKGLLSKTAGRYSSTNTVEMAIDKKVDSSEFGTIAYSGLDGSDMSVYPTSYRKGGAPSLPKPERPGYRFAGWTWSGHSTPTTDPNEIKTAFADGNKTVTLAANWAAPEATYFFAEDKPLDPTGTGEQRHRIFVKLSDSPGKVTKYSLKCDNSLGLFNHFDYSQGFGWSWTTEGSHMAADINKEYTTMGFDLARGDAGYGVYLEVWIPSNALNPSAFPSSLVSGSSVLECFEFEYELA